MAASSYFDAIQSLYVAYFSRPADAAGLAYWAGVADRTGGDTSAVSASFAGSSEYMGLYAGLNSHQIVNTIYQNLFGRGAEPDALKFWGAALDSGAMTIDDAVTQIAGAAQGSDGTAFGNKVMGAVAFTYALDRTSEILGYTGDAANGAARSWLGGITDDGSLERALAPDALAGVVAFVTGLGQAEAGAKLALTTGIDTLAGGAGNDTFTAVYDGMGQGNGTTLTALDVLDGGAGYDTLQISALKDLTALPSVSVSNIEEVVIRAAQGVTADIRAWSGVEQLSLREVHGSASLAAGAATNVNVAGSGLDVDTVRVSGGRDVTVKTSGVDAGNQIVLNGATGAVNVETAGAAAVNGGQLVMGGIDVTGGATVSITQQASLDTSALVGAKAVHEQGAVRVTGTTVTTSVNIKQDAATAGQDAVASVAAVSETATIKFAAMPANSVYKVGGLSFHASVALTAAEVAQAFANLVQGTAPVAGDTQGAGLAANGYFTGAIHGWTSSAAAGDTVVFTSAGSGNVNNLTVQASYGATAVTPVVVNGVAAVAAKAAQMQVIAGRVTVEDTHASIKDVRIDAYGAGSSLVATSALERLALANSSASMTVNDSTGKLALELTKIGSGASDRASLTLASSPATLDVHSVGNNFVTLSAAQTENLNVSGSGTFNVNVGALNTLKAVTVSGAAGLTTGATVLGASAIDASATTGAVSVTINASNTSYAGGAGADTVTLAASFDALTKSLTLGAGEDVLDAQALNASELATMSTVWDGGEGSDTLKLNSVAAQTLSATSAFASKINGFEKLEIGVVGGNTTIKLANLDDINHVIVNGVAAPPVMMQPSITQGVLAKNFTVDFAIVNLASGNDFTIAGRTITAVGGVATAQDVATALLTGTTTGNAHVSGTLGDWTLTGEAGNVVRVTANSNSVTSLPFGGYAPDFAIAQARVAPVTETAVVTFVDLTFGQSFTLAGVTLKAIGPVSAREVADYFLAGTTHPNLAVTGTLDTANWTISNNGGASLVDARFTSKVDGNVTDLAITGVTGGGQAVVTFEQMASGATLELKNDNRVVVQMKDLDGAADVLNVLVASSSTSTVTAHGVETVNVTTNASGALTLAADAASTIVVSGKASTGASAGTQGIYLGAASKAVTMIDGSSASANLNLYLHDAATTQAVTLKGGAGHDVLTASMLNADVLDGGAGNDALHAGKGMARLTGGAGHDVFVVNYASSNVNSYATITDFGKDDLLQLGGMSQFITTKVELGDTAVFQDYANAVINLLGAGHGGWFEFGGNTYVVLDAGNDSTNGFVEGEDFIVKLIGSIDLSQVSFNQGFGTIGLV